MNEDLKWLAENAHEWRDGCCAIQKDDYGLYVFLDGSDLEQYVGVGEVCFTRAQWQAARDELSGKPSWDDAPEWAQWLAQDESGDWWFYEGMPVAGRCSFGNHLIKKPVDSGKILGDWRNTLERRPENHSVEATEKVWRGPEDGLPPVGTDIEVWYDDGKECWKRAVVIGHHPESKRTVAVNVNTEGHSWKLVWSNHIRPIRSEEGRAVDAMAALLGFPECHATKQICRRLYRAGYRKQETE